MLIIKVNNLAFHITEHSKSVEPRTTYNCLSLLWDRHWNGHDCLYHRKNDQEVKENSLRKETQ